MLTAIHPLLPMRNKQVTQEFYTTQLGFQLFETNDLYSEYLMVYKDAIEIHFFLSKDLDPLNHDGMVYIRCSNIDALYEDAKNKNLDIPELGHLKNKPWNQREFALRDPDHNLITFGQSLL